MIVNPFNSGKGLGKTSLMMGTKTINVKPVNLVKYTPSTWAEWTKTNVATDSTGASFTNLSSGNNTILKSGTYKPSTVYGLLYYVVSSTLTSDTFSLAGSTAFPATGLPKTVGYQKLTVTSLASISTNQINIYLDGATGVDGNAIKIKDLRVFEITKGSQLESDFSLLSASLLNTKYPFI